MALSSDDRKAFSLKIVSADAEVAVFTKAKEQISDELGKLQQLDVANKNLFDPVHAKTNQYQLEVQVLEGQQRSTFTETDIQNSAAVILGNYFFPNNTQITVPSLAATNNVWVKPKPFALTYAIGKNYTEARPTITKEGDLIQAIATLITAAGSNLPMENTTGQHLVAAGSCSLSQYTDQASCQANGGTWTSSGNNLEPYPAVVTLKNNMVTAVNALKTFLQTEVGYIVTNDSDTAAQAQNNAAISNINTVIIPALNAWLAYVDFNSTGVTASNFLSFPVNTLAPTKLHPLQLAALTTALNTRLSFISTRITQLNTVLGSLSQDINTGELTASSGLYGRRYGFLVLRIDRLNGSLSKLTSLQNAISAQDAMISSIKLNKQTYLSVVPTTLLAAPGNDTAVVSVVDATAFAPGDTVYVMAEDQIELQRAIKSINGKTIVLNDIVPAKYKTTNSLRLYKDLT